MFSLVCFVDVIGLVGLNNKVSDEPKQNQGRGLVDHKPVKPHPSVILLLAVPKWYFCFGSSWLLYVLCIALSVIDIQ